ncbi:MAG TPA: hypothetical protein VII06_25310 [Chloroflexota bacterium]
MTGQPASVARSRPTASPLPLPDAGRYAVAWTGHRPEFFAAPTGVAAAVHEIAATLKGRYGEGLVFLCGGQRGVDTWAAAAAQLLGIRVHLYLPLPVARFAADWQPADRAALEQSWAHAAERIVVDPDGALGAEAYTRRNRLLAECCDVLIAMWTGLGGGGTAETIAFACGFGRAVEEHRFVASGREPQPGERGV